LRCSSAPCGSTLPLRSISPLPRYGVSVSRQVRDGGGAAQTAGWARAWDRL
jgi:hypothetical protein